MVLLTRKVATPKVKAVDKPNYFRAALNVLGAVFAMAGGFFVFTELNAKAVLLDRIRTGK